MKWEQHTEFATYTTITQNVSDRAFNPADFEVFPPDWLTASPGQRVTSAMVRVVVRPSDEEIKSKLLDWFEPESLAAARVLDDTAICASDFRIDPTGHMRFALFVTKEAGQRRTGRVIQRLCEIETYKAMSMLGFARVKQLAPRIGELDEQLTRLMGQMTDNAAYPDELLPNLLSISTELETISAQCSFRFGATGAYEALVNQRIEVLREERFKGWQSFADFMMRRYDPAMRTVKSTERRLQALSDRAIRAGDLLRTRVDVERSAQNQALLESMDRRSDLALRLQHTVEGLSVVAISYYAVSLVSYLLYPLTRAGVSKGMLTAAVTIPVVLGVWMAVRQIRKRLE